MLSRRTLIGYSLVMIPAAAFAGTAAAKTAITVYKSPSCGCCGGWVDHLKAAGYQVRVVPTADLTPIARKVGVPDALRSCHTATVAGYFIEGHVPVADVRTLLTNRPAARGIAVAGMPRGSPGMEMGGARDPFVTMIVPRSGAPTVFARHG